MSRSDPRPNILWVSFEDTYPYYGCYGDPVARTPTLDRLAAEGCRWPNAFSTAGVCAPARSAIITGMYPISIGTHHMRTTHGGQNCPDLPTPYAAVPPHYVKCFPEYLRAAGYFCTNNEKTDYQFDPPVTAWDVWSGEAHWRDRPDAEQPFFSVFNLGASHESGMWPGHCPETTFDPADMNVPPWLPDTGPVRECLARMYTHIANNDARLAELLGELEEDGLAENTIVFHWSDHGPLPRGKRWPYDAGIRVPMIVRWPGGIGPATVCDDLVSTVDLGPTVLSLAGVPTPARLQGRAFLGPRAVAPREMVFAARDRHDEAYDMVRAARDHRFKYLRNYHPEQSYLSWIPYRNRLPILEEMWRLYAAGELNQDQSVFFRTPRPAEELYDIVQDPHELKNLAGDPAYSSELARMRRALDRWLEEVGDLGRIDEADMVRRWYPDGERPRTGAPLFVPICAEQPGRERTADGGVFTAPCLLQLHCGTQGASVAYRFDEDPGDRWRLYTEPIRLPPGRCRVTAKAIRIGFLESEEATALFEVTGGGA